MQCQTPQAGQLLIGGKPFRALDDRSWSLARRLADMDMDRIDIQVLSPMPELLSYWLDPADAQIIYGAVNEQIAALVSQRPDRFRGLGAVPMQDVDAAVRAMASLRSRYGLSGIEIGSNVEGVMLGDPRFDPIWQAAQDLDLCIFVHALHPVATRTLNATPMFTALAGFPMDVALTAASMLLAGLPDRFPSLRLGFSHGGGALGSILGRLDKGWEKTDGFGGVLSAPPTVSAQRFFYDSNVYSATYLQSLGHVIAPGRIFVGTDYPYEIMQTEPVSFIESAGLTDAARASALRDAARLFLNDPALGRSASADGESAAQVG